MRSKALNGERASHFTNGGFPTSAEKNVMNIRTFFECYCGGEKKKTENDFFGTMCLVISRCQVRLIHSHNALSSHVRKRLNRSSLDLCMYVEDFPIIVFLDVS